MNPITGFGHRSATHVACLEQEQQLSPGLI